MLEVSFNDVSCRVFLYTLERRASVWYHSLLSNSIHGLRELKKLFLEKFADDKTPMMLLKELGNIKMGKRKIITFQSNIYSFFE